MLLHGAIGDAERPGDLLVGEAFAEEMQHLDLARAQVGRSGGRDARRGGGRVLQVVGGHFHSPHGLVCRARPCSGTLRKPTLGRRPDGVCAFTHRKWKVSRRWRRAAGCPGFRGSRPVDVASPTASWLRRSRPASDAHRHCHVQHRWRCGNFHSMALAPPTMYKMPRNYCKVAGMAGIDKNATGKRGDGVAEPIHGVSP